jgi:catechol 2,3-dioxygenase-like lactoylglutathione lyase family enzyme
LGGETRLRYASYFDESVHVKQFIFELILNIMAIKDSNITINVKDLDKSISFYESIGLTIKNRWGNHYAQLIAPGIAIGLHPTSDNNLAGNSGNVSIGFTTDDFEEVKSSLQKLSIRTTDRQEEGGQFLHFSDPDGTALYFIKPKW